MKSTFSRAACATLAVAIVVWAGVAEAGPETALREFAGGQIKKGVRTIGMGGVVAHDRQ